MLSRRKIQTFPFSFLWKLIMSQVVGTRGLGLAPVIMIIIIYADGYLISTWPDYTLSVRHSLCLSASLPVPCPSIFLTNSFTYSLRDNIGLVTSWNTSRDRFCGRLGTGHFTRPFVPTRIRIYTYSRLQSQIRLSRTIVLANILILL